jgi:hypothetical protein
MDQNKCKGLLLIQCASGPSKGALVGYKCQYHAKMATTIIAENNIVHTFKWTKNFNNQILMPCYNTTTSFNDL